MLIKIFSIYLLSIIIFSLLFILIVLRLKKVLPQVVIPMIIFIILLPIPIGYLYYIYVDSLPELTVPDLAGLKYERAVEKLREIQLEGKKVGEVFDMKYLEGRVVSQRPEAGRKVKIGRMVNLLTSSGKRKVNVPNLLGRPEVHAQAVLAAEGLVVGEVSRDFTPELDADIVLSQNPLPGEEVDLGSIVSLTISSQSQEAIELDNAATTEESKDDEGGGFRLW
jgi:serine/threonine-protein kinase